MIKSMTAFARAEGAATWGNAHWELRSVNNRYLEVSPKLPEDLRSIETPLRERLRERLGRGKVDCNLRVSSSHGGDSGLSVDLALAGQIVNAAKEVGALLAEGRQLGIADVLRWPGVLKADSPDIDAMSADVLVLLNQAIDDLIATREREGARIKTLLESRLSEIEAIVAGVRKRLPEVIEAARQRLIDRLAEFKAQLDQDRVEQEMVIIAQRLDVAEELDRLDGHVVEVRRILGQSDPVGRRLDFMMQELNREANTLGSKANDPKVTQASVDLKVFIEQMREQIQNIE